MTNEINVNKTTQQSPTRLLKHARNITQKSQEPTLFSYTIIDEKNGEYLEYQHLIK